MSHSATPSLLGQSKFRLSGATRGNVQNGSFGSLKSSIALPVAALRANQVRSFFITRTARLSGVKVGHWNFSSVTQSFVPLSTSQQYVEASVVRTIRLAS